MERRQFFKISFLGFLNTWSASLWAKEVAKSDLMTVKGFINQKQMGITLPHEHILVDFIGADKIDTTTYNYDKIYQTALPVLQKLKEAGCQTLIECTPNYLGRSPLLFKRLSEATGINILQIQVITVQLITSIYLLTCSLNRHKNWQTDG